MRLQVLPVDRIEFPEALSLAVIELYDGHARDVLLQECIDLRDRNADPAVGRVDPPPRHGGCDGDQRNDRKRDEAELPVEDQDRDHDSGEREDVAKDRNNSGGEQFVEDIDVRDDAREQAADGILIVKGWRQRLQVAEDLHAHVVHDLLAGILKDVRLQGGRNELGDQQNGENTGDVGKTAQVVHGDVVVDRDHDQPWEGDFQDRFRENQQKRDGDVLLVRPKIGDQPAHQSRVVCFTEYFFFLHRYSLTASSSSSNCLLCNSA